LPSSAVLISRGRVELGLSEKGGTEIADAFFNERVGSDELEAFHLSEVGLLARHVDEEQFCDVAGTQSLFVFLDPEKGTEKDYRMAAISFWYSARSSAWVLQLRILVINSWSLII
jgi:hypothetical protein